MAALVQSYPQQSGTITMLQARPSSAGGILQTGPQAQSHQQRNSFHGINPTFATSTYRGHTAMAPIAPYAFTSTPNLALPAQRISNGPHLRPDQRTTSAPIVPVSQGLANRSRYPAAASVSTTSSSSSSDLSALSQKSGSKDDSALGTARVSSGVARSQPATLTPSVTLIPSTTTSTKPSPDRYRRPIKRTESNKSPSPQLTPTMSSSTTMNDLELSAKAPQLPEGSYESLQLPDFSRPISGFSTTPAVAIDDLRLKAADLEQAMRYRRRSIHTINVPNHDGVPAGLVQHGSRQVSSADGRIGQHPLRSSPVMSFRPAVSHERNQSTESAKSARSSASRPSSATNRDTSLTTVTPNPAQYPTSQFAASNILNESSSNNRDVPRLVNIPPRASSTDAAKRIAPSPLSKPVTMSTEPPTISKDSFASTVNAALQAPSKPTYAQVATNGYTGSPAAQQLAALNDKDGKKSKTSRLRRAFSFGSAAELRRASAENSAANNAADRSKVRKEKYLDEQDAEQTRIAQQQEAAGLGSGIYSGQGNFFSGSTDNLSISSTASSASIMIRKMGKGMKKSTRSLVGLFRPKSVIGVPAADGPVPQASQAQVSMVTVEAEREKVNVNLNPHDHAGGGTGYPKLARNSMEAAAAPFATSDRLGSSGTETSSSRRSIVGGEKERAEVLAAVKKGILKRSGTDPGNSSPTLRPLDAKSTNFILPKIMHSESPSSSAPSTPNDENSGHKHTGSVTLGGEDYFMSALRLQGQSKSVPGTPDGAIKRNATFSPRIQFHDTWPSGEYDRRGEIATCNRLTPMLAQQIKEELNTFKMEMEVHENSKIYTHFF